MAIALVLEFGSSQGDGCGFPLMNAEASVPCARASSSKRNFYTAIQEALILTFLPSLLLIATTSPSLYAYNIHSPLSRTTPQDATTEPRAKLAAPTEP